MKAFKILALLFLCTILHLSNAYAQQDYVINRNHDTVFCKIKENFFSGILKYKVSGERKDKDFDDVIGYFLAADTATFVYKKIPGRMSFTYVKWLERGKINLYELILTSGYRNITNGFPVGSFGNSGSGQESNKYLYISKGTDSLIQIKTDAISFNNIGSHKERIKAFLDRVSDCDYVATELKYSDLNKNYDFDLIQSFIKMYNDKCPDK